jgi:hypothetical protein
VEVGAAGEDYVQPISQDLDRCGPDEKRVVLVAGRRGRMKEESAATVASVTYFRFTGETLITAPPGVDKI